MKCCPINLLDGGLEDADGATVANGTVQAPLQLSDYQLGGGNVDWSIFCCCPIKDRESLTSSLFQQPQTWYHHESFETDLFKKYLYYAYCDFREYIPELPINDRQFVCFSIESQRYFNQTRDKARRNMISFVHDVHKQKYAPKTGLKGICMLFLLWYFRLSESVSYDALHVFKNIILYILYEMKGINAVGDAVAAHCKLKGLHPSLWEGKNTVNVETNTKKGKSKNKNTKTDDKTKTYGPWFIPKRIRELIDMIFQSIYIPTNESGNYELSRGIFRQTGNLKTVALIRLLINYMDLLVFAGKVEKSYGEFLSMLSADACRLFEPLGTAEDIEEDTNRVKETVAVMDGMFPESERYFTVHEILHLSDFRKMQGGLRNTWTASAERFVGKVAEFAKEGGRSFDKTIWRKYLAFEVDARSRFEELSTENDKDSPFLRLEYDLDTNETSLLFSESRYFLCDEIRDLKYFSKNVYFFGSILNALLFEIERQSHTAAHAMRSPLYQLMQVFLLVHERKKLLKYVYVPEIFAEWLITKELTSQVAIAKGDSMNNLLIFNEPIDFKGMVAVQKSLRFFFQRDGMKVFKNAFIGGQKFTSRGYEFHDGQRPQLVSFGDGDPHYRLTTDSNKIRNVLRGSKGCDSICKLLVPEDLTVSLGDIMKRDYEPREGKKPGNEPSYGTNIQLTECAASINFFFRMKLPNCPIFKNGIPFAAVNAWSIKSHERIDLTNCDDRVSYLPGVRFIPLVQIVPTRIALTCMNAKYEILSSKLMSSSNSRWIVLLDMDRTKRKIQKMMNRKEGPIYNKDRQ
jgi:hypothetical protein